MPIFILTANLAAQFYFKWVPDINDQKRHLRTGGWWALDIVSVGSLFGILYNLAGTEGPVTHGFVVAVAVTASLCVLSIVVIGIRRSASRLLRISESSARHLGLTMGLCDALIILTDAVDLPIETRRAV